MGNLIERAPLNPCWENERVIVRRKNHSIGGECKKGWKKLSAFYFVLFCFSGPTFTILFKLQAWTVLLPLSPSARIASMSYYTQL